MSGALADGTFYGLHDRKQPPNPLINPYETADGRWLVLVASPPHWPALAHVIGLADLVKDQRFTDPDAMAQNSRALTEILDRAFASQPLAQWEQALDQARTT